MRILGYLFGLTLLIACAGVAAHISAGRHARFPYDPAILEF